MFWNYIRVRSLNNPGMHSFAGVKYPQRSTRRRQLLKNVWWGQNLDRMPLFVCLWWLSGTGLPLSALRFLVSPVQLLSAAIWQTMEQKVLADYGMLEEYVSMVSDVVPDLLTIDQRAQLTLGLRARVRRSRIPLLTTCYCHTSNAVTHFCAYLIMVSFMIVPVWKSNMCTI